VTGWAYQTLDGHFEQGEMHYQVWKWLDSGEVEFRLHAVSKAADTGPWLLRTGFRVLGRTNQLRFYRQICRRVRRLTDATLEARRMADTRRRRRRRRPPSRSRGQPAPYACRLQRLGADMVKTRAIKGWSSTRSPKVGTS
jgi:Domain of unknown function (DUF1990)